MNIRKYLTNSNYGYDNIPKEDQDEEWWGVSIKNVPEASHCCGATRECNNIVT